MLLIPYDWAQGPSMLEAQRSRRFDDMAEFGVSVFLTAERGRIPRSLLNRSAPSRSGRREIFSQRFEFRLESNGLGIPARVRDCGTPA